MVFKKDKKKVGRKQFDGKDIKTVLQKLEEVWTLGGTDEEACLYADISIQALMDFQRKNPKVSVRKKLLKQNPILLARRAVIKAIKKDNSDIALKFLERRKKDEFSLKQEHDHQHKVINITVSDKESKV